MLTTNRAKVQERRGIVLILILGMLGLLAFIGVTFATIAGQARIGARNYVQSTMRPQPAELMEFALSQLIGDTDDPRSAIRGHSLARDMYGNDAQNNGYVDRAAGYYFTGAAATPAGTVDVFSRSLAGTIQCLTTIPAPTSAAMPYYGYDFTRWVVKFDGMGVSTGGYWETRVVGQTFEVVYDDAVGVTVGGSAVRVFYLSPVPSQPVGPRSYAASPEAVVSGNHGVNQSMLQSEYSNLVVGSLVPVGTTFTIDGRFLRAFNGPGMGPLAQYPNMRYNGGLLGGDASTVKPGEPSLVGMDEDYDACDLENWFLAIQSADGKTIVPSFHRPGIVQFTNALNNDWVNPGAPSRSRILRPRKADGHDPLSFPDLNPKANGTITYDVDNDVDGTTDSVWVDLGYPPVRDNRGELYKPMFAFMVIGLNGRIPLNTAGNLNRRDDNGNPVYLQASHLGYSPSEIDPSYGLQASPWTGGVPNGMTQLDNANNGAAPISVNVTQLRNILAGTHLPDPRAYGFSGLGERNVVPALNNYPLPNNVPDLKDLSSGGLIPITSPAVAGRWGEPSFITSMFNIDPSNTAYLYTPYMGYANPVRAGMSMTGTNQAVQIADGRDDDDTARDAWPSPGLGEFPGSAVPLAQATDPSGNPWPADYYDAALDRPIFAERARRFVTPMDVSGDGQESNFHTTNLAGADEWGRVRYANHFRPPGMPVATADGVIVPDPPSPPKGPGAIVGKGATVLGEPSVYDVTNNPYHGFESHRNTSFTPVISSSWQQALRNAAAPTNLDPLGNDGANNPGGPVPTSGGLAYNTGGTPTGTFGANITSLLPGSPGLNDPNETNLYVPNGTDQVFGGSDLEWLYRAHDVDGSSLHSRLSDLAPLSFRDSADALRRRRLYSIDVWDANSFAWTNDNPGGFNATGVYTTLPPGGNFSDNSRFPSAFAANAATSLPGIVSAAAGALANAGLPMLTAQGVPYVATPDLNPLQSTAPSLAHRDRKINLNYPLPVSNELDEPTRLKWIAESYQFLKTVLPPLSIDTPEELAALSQFLVNIIDFRDPDATMTRFVNPDVFIRPSPASGVAPDLLLRTNPAWAATDLPLVQYGMEYNPIAINEVLAYAYQTKTNANPPVPRFFIELVNTLTDAQTAYPTILDAKNASWLNLGGVKYVANDPYGKTSGFGGCWDLIFTDDDPYVRPDPFTGQLPSTAASGYYGPVPLHRDSFVDDLIHEKDVVLRALRPYPLDPPAPNPNYYYCIGNPLSAPSAEVNTPKSPKLSKTMTSNVDPFTEVGGAQGDPPFAPNIPAGVLPNNATKYPPRMTSPTTVQTSSKYQWVCLRRPANPFKPVSDQNPMIVVDSMRFPFIEGSGLLAGSKMKDDKGNPVPDTSKGNQVYSIERYEPYRGGQLVPQTAGTALDPARFSDVTRYGYTEQPGAISNPQIQVQGVYSVASDGKTPFYATKTVNETLGMMGNHENWQRFVFNDRDFVSPAELLLVPGCPPGLFTKQFVEFTPSKPDYLKKFYDPSFSDKGKRLTTPPVSTSTPNSLVGTPQYTDPPTFPYLVDQLYYSSASPAYNGATMAAPNAPASISATNWDRAAGPSSGGWYKMFEVFEVPSTVIGATGPVAQGVNFDRLRQDVRPGQVNLNLIIDEEVFLGVMGNAGFRLDAQPTANDLLANGDPTPLQAAVSVPTYLNGQPVPWRSVTPPIVPPPAPRVVTQVNPLGVPTASYESSHQGFYDQGTNNPFIKQAFSDFLALRHGVNPYVDLANPLNNTNFLYFGAPPPQPGQTAWPVEAPFRSLTYPDVNATIMRPAYPTKNQSPPDHGLTKQDSGIKNVDLVTRYYPFAQPTPYYPPARPARRLFQLVDQEPSSNASLPMDSDVSQTGYIPPTVPSLQDTSVNLANRANRLNDTAQHPYYRSEWLQKLMNLTTVRTHQYAVWITIGFFQVTAVGDAAAGQTNPNAAYDVIGREVGTLAGKNVRHRGFFIVDRLKLGGFDPRTPGQYKDAVVYRRIIQ